MNLMRIGETRSRNIRKKGLVSERFPKVPNGVRPENEHASTALDEAVRRVATRWYPQQQR